MNIFDKIAEICSNSGYAAIIAAIIAAVVAVGIAIYNKHKKGASDSPTVIVIPPPIDPLSDLHVDIVGIKDIDEEDINSLKYVKLLATRMKLLKNPNSQADVFYEEDSDD